MSRRRTYREPAGDSAGDAATRFFAWWKGRRDSAVSICDAFKELSFGMKQVTVRLMADRIRVAVVRLVINLIARSVPI